jgi:hypothetical protein
MPPRVGDIPRIKSQNPISLREVSRASAASGEKITLPEALVRVPGSCRVAATNLAGRPVRIPLPRARNPKGHRFRCRVPEFWPDSLSPSLRRSTTTRHGIDNGYSHTGHGRANRPHKLGWQRQQQDVVIPMRQLCRRRQHLARHHHPGGWPATSANQRAAAVKQPHGLPARHQLSLSLGQPSEQTHQRTTATYAARIYANLYRYNTAHDASTHPSSQPEHTDTRRIMSCCRT